MEAADPFQALAVSLEFRRYHQCENKDMFITHLPIYIDATCNGLQHLASMSSEANLAKLVNLTRSTYLDSPQDIYTEMCKLIEKEIKTLVKLKVNDEPKLVILLSRW